MHIKTSHTIILSCFIFGCLGQSIKPMIDERGHFYNGNAPKKDTIPSLSSANAEFVMSSHDDKDKYVEMRIITKDTFYTVEGDSLTAIKLLFKAWHDEYNYQQQQDSSMYYFKKFIYYNQKMDKATGRAFARFEDSCMRYKKLLDRLKK